VVTVDGTPMMYMESGWPNIGAGTRPQRSRSSEGDLELQEDTDRDDSAVPRACCDNRHPRMSFADGKVVFGSLDGFVIALDAKTGKERLGGEARLPGQG